jgi:GNAT superfamily N-acetyltransferase
MIIRPAEPGDVAELHAMILELADYEHLRHEVRAGAADTERALFSANPSAEALIAQCEGQAAGFAVFFPFYSTFAGHPGLYLEDLFVRERFRRRGIGLALTTEFLRLARQRGCPKVEWRVLRWNKPALDFYRSIGATILDDWVPARVEFLT